MAQPSQVQSTDVADDGLFLVLDLHHVCLLRVDDKLCVSVWEQVYELRAEHGDGDRGVSDTDDVAREVWPEAFHLRRFSAVRYRVCHSVFCW